MTKMSSNRKLRPLRPKETQMIQVNAPRTFSPPLQRVFLLPINMPLTTHNNTLPLSIIADRSSPATSSPTCLSPQRGRLSVRSGASETMIGQAVIAQMVSDDQGK